MGLTQSKRDKTIEIAISEVGDRVPVLCRDMDAGAKKVIENIERLE